MNLSKHKECLYSLYEWANFENFRARRELDDKEEIALVRLRMSEAAEAVVVTAIEATNEYWIPEFRNRVREAWQKELMEKV